VRKVELSIRACTLGKAGDCKEGRKTGKFWLIVAEMAEMAHPTGNANMSCKWLKFIAN
jgi:hypothetical protein